MPLCPGLQEIQQSLPQVQFCGEQLVGRQAGEEVSARVLSGLTIIPIFQADNVTFKLSEALTDNRSCNGSEVNHVLAFAVQTQLQLTADAALYPIAQRHALRQELGACMLNCFVTAHMRKIRQFARLPGRQEVQKRGTQLLLLLREGSFGELAEKGFPPFLLACGSQAEHWMAPVAVADQDLCTNAPLDPFLERHTTRQQGLGWCAHSRVLDGLSHCHGPLRHEVGQSCTKPLLLRGEGVRRKAGEKLLHVRCICRWSSFGCRRGGGRWPFGLIRQGKRHTA
mmetsp:Transcript_2009/g.5459  ORF Transcript_2009/g.5459 Transcript_2009/m.5459 type:complete len:282 (+) Transcript_2009:947-1792(+)